MANLFQEIPGEDTVEDRDRRFAQCFANGLSQSVDIHACKIANVFVPDELVGFNVGAAGN
jgi:hypothetical protein